MAKSVAKWVSITVYSDFWGGREKSYGRRRVFKEKTSLVFNASKKKGDARKGEEKISRND